MNTIRLLLACATVLIAGASRAAPIGEPSDLSGDLTVITFDEFVLGMPLPLVLPDLTISTNGSAAVVGQAFVQHPGIFEGPYAGHGVQSYFFDFTAPVAQFGVGVFDPNFAGNVLRALDVFDNVLETIVSPSLDFTVGPPGGAHSTFVGFVRSSADIARVELLNAPGDLLGIDTVTYSTDTVPAPGALALFGFGLLGFGLRSRA